MQLHQLIVAFTYHRRDIIELAIEFTKQEAINNGSSSIHLLKELHWLPVQWRIKFKIATLTFKALKKLDNRLTWPSSYVHTLLPELYALPRPNLFKFH